MAGYTRQSVADIIANAVIKAAPVNAEFNAIRDAFNSSTGHKHDGTSSEGTYVPLIADIDANNKVVVDTTNNRIGIFTEVGGSAVEQLRIQDGAIVPVTDDDIDLGASGTEFKDLYIDGIGYIDSVVITGGTIDGTVIGSTTPAAADFTTMDTTGNASVGGTFNVTGTSTFTGAMSAGSLTTTGNSTHATVDINGGAIDGTIIGTSSAAAGTFTTVTTTGQATLATADINGGTIDGSVIGGATPQAVTGTTITANTGFTGALTGNVTGNVTGNLTGDVTGDVTGDLTGNVTASSGTSSFTDVTINGTLNMNAGTTATITNLSAPTNANDAARKVDVDNAVANLVDSAPGTLDTLNELAAALGDDADFSNTVTTSIATKLPLAGGTMTGAIAMSTNKITGVGDPTAAQDVSSKAYTDTQDATKLNLSGGTMTGNIVLGANKATSTATPTAADDLTRKGYVDGILGSATAAATSAANAATSETNAATSETNAGNSAAAAAASYDDFDDRYLGAKASAPSVDNDGDALVTGALYWNSTSNELYVWGGSAWEQGSFTAGSLLSNVVEDTTPQLGGNLDSNGNDITFGDNDKAIFGAGSDLQIYHDGSASYIKDTGVGQLNISGSAAVNIIDTSGNNMLRGVEGAQASLYYAGVNKLNTTSTGIDVTGTATADKVSVVHAGGGDFVGVFQNTTSATPYGVHIKDAASGANGYPLLQVTNSAGSSPYLLVHSGTGNVGIGTSSPNTKIDAVGSTTNSSGIVDTLRLRNTGVAGGDGAKIQFTAGASTSGAGIGSGGVALNSADLRFYSGGNTERMRIDSSGNLLVGTTSTSLATTSSETGAMITDGSFQAAANNPVAQFNRITSDGAIVNFRKDGTTVGSIGSVSGVTAYIDGGSGFSGIQFGGDGLAPRDNGALADNTSDLGTSSYRFKDLYLSGGVVETTTTVTYASSIALSYDNGSIQTVTLTGNVTFTDSLADGEAVVLMLNAGASHTVTWTAVNKWVTSGGNVAPTLTANDTLVFWKIGSTVYGAYAGSYT